MIDGCNVSVTIGDIDEVCVSFIPAIDQALMHLLVDSKRLTSSSISINEPYRLYELDEHELALGR